MIKEVGNQQNCVQKEKENMKNKGPLNLKLLSKLRNPLLKVESKWRLWHMYFISPGSPFSKAMNGARPAIS